jgi:hypothetical protein
VQPRFSLARVVTAVPDVGQSAMLPNPYESPRTKNLKPRPTGFRPRLALLFLGNAALIAAAISLLVVGKHFHDEYGKAHQAAFQGARVSVEPHYQRARYASAGIGLICVAALIVALKTKHPISFVALVLCVGLLVYGEHLLANRY